MERGCDYPPCGGVMVEDSDGQTDETQQEFIRSEVVKGSEKIAWPTLLLIV